MKAEHIRSFPWSLSADFQTDEQTRQRARHAAERLARLTASASGRRVKRRLLLCLHRAAAQDYLAEATLRSGDLLFHAEGRGAVLSVALETALAALERNLKRHFRSAGGPSGPTAEAPKTLRSRVSDLIPPVEEEAPGAGVPKTPSDVLEEATMDHLRRLRRFARRRLRTEAIIHPDWPIGEISDGDIVDETVSRLLRKHPRDIPYGAFWSWAIRVCEEVIEEQLGELRRSAELTISLEESANAADDADEDDGYDVEHPFYILQRILEPFESELEDATPDERAAAPSTIAEYDDFVGYLHERIASWPLEKRQLVELYCFEGMDPREIADLQGRTQAEVLGELNAILPQLREAMGEAPSRRD